MLDLAMSMSMSMSSSSKLKPSAFDVLMSVNKKKQQPSPSKKSESGNKRKQPSSSNETLGSATQDYAASSQNPSAYIITCSSLVAKKNKSADEGRLAQLKNKILLLKKKTEEFDPKAVACWNNGEPVPFLFLSLVFDMISTESRRIVSTDILCNALRTVMHTTPDDLVATVYLYANQVSPAHEGLELGIGDGSIIKAISEAYGWDEKSIKNQYTEDGDLGLLAKASRSSQSMLCKFEPLTVVKIFSTFRIIAKEAGKDSRQKKMNHIKTLLVAATDCEPQYLIYLLQTKLRIGSAEQTLLAALGQAAVYTDKHSKPPSNIQSPLEEAAKIVKQVHSVLPVYDKIIHALLSNGVWNLAKMCNITPGVPVGSMLAKPTKRVSEIINKFQDMVYTCEYKYDGERAQIHYMEDGTLEIYSRNGERNTTKFPDVVIAVSRVKKPPVRSFILDCEIVAYDHAKDKILPFQILSTRARKNVAVRDIKVDVCVFAFDMLYLNDEPLIQEQLEVRRASL